MSLFRHWQTDPDRTAAIWKIEETEEWFAEQVALSAPMHHPKKRLEFLAARYLLKWLQPAFPLSEIRPDEHDKPRIKNNILHFSLSHSFPYVAAVISSSAECGIDIQVWHKRITTVQHKFLSEEEQACFQNDPRQLTLAWCAKEAAYKWQGKRGIDFIEHLPITQYTPGDSNASLNIHLCASAPPREIQLQGMIEKDFAFAIVLDK